MSKSTRAWAIHLRPLPIVQELPTLCSPKARILDVGTGTGRNALFLARHGFQVDAIDRSAQAVAKLNTYADAHALPLRAAVHDIRERDPEFIGYALILCTLALHYLTPARANALLAQARMQATSGTLHVLGLITAEGDFFRDSPHGEWFYPEPDEIRRTYAEARWEIHRAFEEEREMRATHADGSPVRNLVSFVIARKPLA